MQRATGRDRPDSAEITKLAELWLLPSLDQNVKRRMEVAPGEEG